MYELKISNESDASSGLYETRREAMAAADDAAARDGLTARYGCGDARFFVDGDDRAWFHFAITRYEDGDAW